ncbi:septal ring lytic transglycosylase RlpA family lipoprotein [Azospirillum baldaniorum]|uniref:Endolytic peptidoglycan transglycosylase RlpA n=1 Tax=Azospirillum baldaniorum TaxID=1064539 RepID=A0A9P1JPK9_9PROT|nr:septal ring lytic transglycosylase RlpA family protein [Azospirillum baldaniorum]AWJ90466.1 septal ring lytic transglycosylase RlpA family lipoprotein [Azospirillum baldaniorum]TWA75344.1 rare lipoprotein A [Azospirillum brasilense]CCC97385.1 rare lipoprotein A [Azospirillum baldaniorum]
MHMARILSMALCALSLSLPLSPMAAQAQPSSKSQSAKDASVPPIAVERTDEGEPVIVHEGEASFYGGSFHGRKTASGERFDQNKPTAASRELPLGSKVTVTNQDNGKSVDVIVNDRGPYVDGRVIDLSKKAAKQLDMIEDGVAPVRVEAKPSEQPTEAVKEKVEAKAEKADQTQVAEQPGSQKKGNGAALSGSSGAGSSRTDQQSGSGSDR